VEYQHGAGQPHQPDGRLVARQPLAACRRWRQWALEAIAVYAVDEGAGAVRGLGLFRAISTAAARVLRERVGASQAGAYTLDIAGQKIEIANTGVVSLPMLFQIPKEDKDIDLLVKFKASRHRDRVTTTPIDVSVVKR
jgi:hypothetical protein